MNRMSDEHIPMATNQTWTGVFLTVLVQVTEVSHPPHLSALLHSACQPSPHVNSSSNMWGGAQPTT